jgi:hypothetical protein
VKCGFWVHEINTFRHNPRQDFMTHVVRPLLKLKQRIKKMNWKQYVKHPPKKSSPKKNIGARLEPDLQAWFGQCCGEAGAPVHAVLNAMLRSIKDQQEVSKAG